MLFFLVLSFPKLAKIRQMCPLDYSRANPVMPFQKPVVIYLSTTYLVVSLALHSLQRYVRERITAFAGEKAFAQRLHLSPSVVQNAAVETLTELSVEGNWSPAAAQCGLVFRHDCM